MNQWPLQSQCDDFYGNPRGVGDRPSRTWEARNLVRIFPSFQMTYDGRPYAGGITIHKKCAESLGRVLEEIWQSAGKQQEVVDEWGVSAYGGAYNYRLKRGGNTLSQHSWGCAIDLDPDRNGFGDPTPNFAKCPEVLSAFAREGWVWGGTWGKPDGMHWQAALVKGPMASIPPGPELTQTPAGLQRALVALGYGPLQADGVIGKATREALLHFQHDAGLRSDGIAGPKTWAALGEALRKKGG